MMNGFHFSDIPCNIDKMLFCVVSIHHRMTKFSRTIFSNGGKFSENADQVFFVNQTNHFAHEMIYILISLISMIKPRNKN